MTIRTLEDFHRQALAAYEDYKTGKKKLQERNDPIDEAAYVTAMYEGSDAAAVRISKLVPDPGMQMYEAEGEPKSSWLYKDCCRKRLADYLYDYLTSHLAA